ncbi:MAG: tetratricopeptide repeat-containing sensor histidine kinase [Bacteroidota bacterium]
MKILRMILIMGFTAVLLATGSANSQQKADSLRLLLEKTTDPVVKASVLKQLTRISFESGDYVSAIQYLNREVSTHLSNGDSVSWSNAQYSLGMVYSIVRNFEEAARHGLLAKEFFEKNLMYPQVANSCINLGYIYNELKKPDKAIEFYQRSLIILEEQNNQQGMEASYLNLGVLGDKTGAIDKTRKNYEESQDVTRRINSTSLIAVYTNLGILYLNKGDVVRSEGFLDKAFIMARETGNLEYVATAQISLGSVYFKTGRKPEAYRTIEKGIELARKLGLRKLTMEAYAELSKVSMSLNQPVLAYNFLEIYSRLKDSLYNEQIASQINNVQTRFEVGRKELDSERMLRENLEQSLRLERDQNSRIALISALVVIIVLLGIFFKRYYFKAKSANDLQETNQLIEDQKAELEQLILTKDRFLSIIAHDLKNPFTSLLGFADLAYTEFDEITDQEKRSYLGIIRQSSQHIYSLLDNLLTWSRAQSGRIDFNPEPVNLLEVVDSSTDLVRTAAENKQISLYTDFAKDVIVKADKNMLSTVIRNLLSNAIKFTPNGGSVTVSCTTSNGKANLSISDTGIGLDQDELSRLFKIDGNLKNPGTNNETGTGLGLILCQEFMNIHKSKITAQSTPGKGSVFSFSLDVA